MEEFGIEENDDTYLDVETMLIHFYGPAWNGEKGIALDIEPTLPQLARLDREEDASDELLEGLIEHGYVIHFRQGNWDYYEMTRKFREFILSHFPAEAMLWEPDCRSRSKK